MKKTIYYAIIFSILAILIGFILLNVENRTKLVTKEKGISTKLTTKKTYTVASKLLEEHCDKNNNVCIKFINFIESDYNPTAIAKISNYSSKNIDIMNITITFVKDKKEISSITSKIKDLDRRTSINTEYQYQDKKIIEAEDYEISVKYEKD